MTRCDLAFTTDLAPFSLRHRTPDTELLARHDGEFETLSAHRTFTTNLFCDARRCTSFREEEVRVCAATVGKILPGEVSAFGLEDFYEVWEHVNSVNL
jgi:hypothetical protein